MPDNQHESFATEAHMRQFSHASGSQQPFWLDQHHWTLAKAGQRLESVNGVNQRTLNIRVKSGHAGKHMRGLSCRMRTLQGCKTKACTLVLLKSSYTAYGHSVL